MRWPNDSHELTEAEEQEKEGRWWDFEKASSAVYDLLEALPRMKDLWHGQQWAPESRNVYPALCRLERALNESSHPIQYPFGECEHHTKIGKKAPKDWHIVAVLIAQIFHETLPLKARPLRLSGNSVVPRVIDKALTRMGYPHGEMRSNAAIAAHLRRWRKRYGNWAD